MIELDVGGLKVTTGQITINLDRDRTTVTLIISLIHKTDIFFLPFTLSLSNGYGYGYGYGYG